MYFPMPSTSLYRGESVTRYWSSATARRAAGSPTDCPTRSLPASRSVDDLARALASADIFFNPSVTEAFGNVTLEAMACGLPVVAASATGATNLVRDRETGMLAEPGEIDQFADALAAYIADPGLRQAHGAAGLAFAETQDWDLINAAVESAYHRVIERRARIARALAK